LSDFAQSCGAISPSECYATTNFLERDLIGSATTTELAAATGEDTRTAAETWSVLLAAAGREPSDPVTDWSNGATDGSSEPMDAD